MRPRVSFFALLALYAALAFAQADASLVAKLRQGGYVLYMRHTSTDFSQNDARMASYEDCANQRNLTDKGRAEARELGTHVKRLGIPVGPVYASPFCRTMETARLAFGRAEPMTEARGGPNASDAKRYEPLRQLMTKNPPAGQNAVIASHGNPFHALFGPPYLAEGEIAVLQPDAASGPLIVGRIRIGDWQSLH